MSVSVKIALAQPRLAVKDAGPTWEAPGGGRATVDQIDSNKDFMTEITCRCFNSARKRLPIILTDHIIIKMKGKEDTEASIVVSLYPQNV